MAVDVAPASLMRWPTARIYIRGAGLGHAGPFPQPGFDHSPLTRAAIINNLGATQLQLVAPSALVPSLLPTGCDLLPCMPAYCPASPFLQSGVEWGVGARRGFLTPATRLTHLDPELPDCTV